MEVNRPPRAVINGHGPKPEDSATVRNRVIAARARQLARNGVPNAQMSNTQVRACCRLTPSREAFLESVADIMNLSPRACQRILKVARTQADMDEAETIEEQHLAEAVTYRERDPGTRSSRNGQAVRSQLTTK